MKKVNHDALVSMRHIFVILFHLVCVLQFAVHASDVAYIHTDANDYYAGDRIWMRVYLFDSETEKCQYADKYVYVELYDPSYMLIKRVRIIQQDSAYCGYIDLPKQAETGVWSLRAFTRYMTLTSSSLPLQPVFIYGKRNSKEIAPLTLPLLSHEEMAYDTILYASIGEQIHIPLDDLADVSVAMIDELKIQRHQGIGIEQMTDRHIAEPTDSTVQREICALLGGRVQTLWRKKPIAGAQVNLIIPAYQLYATTFTDETGRWLFSDVDLPEGTQCILAVQQDSRDKNRHTLQLVVDEDIYPSLYEADTTLLASILVPSDSSFWQLTMGEYTNLDSALLLEEISVTAKYYNESKQEKVTAKMADMSFGEKQIEEFGVTCIHELLRRVPSVRVFQDRCYIRTKNSIFGDTPAAIAVDGVIQEDTYDLDVVQMQDIARVDIFKTGSTVIWGPRGGSGVVSIIMKDGAMNTVQNSPDSPSMKRVTLAGYQRPEEFDYTSFSPTRTVMWQPHLRQSTVSVTMPPRRTRYRLVIEGVGTDQKIVHKEIGIEVE